MTLTREPIAEVQVTLLRIPLAKGSLTMNDLSNGWCNSFDPKLYYFKKIRKDGFIKYFIHLFLLFTIHL